MAEAKPFASLTSSLLARKGQAKPAMRPQAFGHGSTQDDLGWNDMGYGPRAVALNEPHPYPAPVPTVVRQQEEIAEEFAPAIAAEPAPTPAPAVVAEVPQPAAPAMPAAAAKPTPAVRARRAVAPKPKAATVTPTSKASGKARAAFTLRLDPDRHLKLRLACAVTGRSAQQIVTEALEDLLKTMPEIEAVAGQLPTSAARAQR